jgi:intracellular septation protein
MQLLFDLFPVILFFAAFKLAGIYVATGVAIVASIAQVAWVWLRRRRVEAMHLITLGLIVVLGGATLLLQDEMFIKWKPSVVNWLFAVVFLGSQFVGEKPLVRRFMESKVELPAFVWIRLNLSWVAFFTLLGFANLFVVYRFDTETWVNFKLFGMMGLTVAFVLAQALYLARYIPEGSENTPAGGA